MATPKTTKLTPEQIECLGSIADKLDAILYSAKLPMPAETHIVGLTGCIREARDEIASIVRHVSGDDPWKDNPLVG